MKPLDGVAAFELSPALVFPMIDRLLGGTGRTITNMRAMTEIEQSIIQGVLKLMIDNLKESWRAVYQIEFALTTTETHPHMVQVTSPNEMIVQFQFQVRMRESVAKMNIAMPTLVLEPIIHIFDQELYSRKKIIHDGTLLHQLRNIPVNISIETAESSFPMESLLTLQVGDTLVLDQKQEWPVQIRVAGKNKLNAVAQMDSNKKAFAVTGYIRPRREDSANGHVTQ
jgi:flagellar motor switch protein FliM